METRVRIRVGNMEVEAVGEEEFVTNRLPDLISDLVGRLASFNIPIISPSLSDEAPSSNAELVSIVGDVRDYWSNALVAGAKITTIGHVLNLIGQSDQAGLFILSGQSKGERLSLLVSGLASYVETINSIELSTVPTTLSVVAVAIPDLNRQYAALGLTRVPDTTTIIIDLLDNNGAPLEMVSPTDITLTTPNGDIVGNGPYFFGASGDIEPLSTLPTSRAFVNRARAALINVPNGEHILQVTAKRTGNTVARLVLAIRAERGATLIQARLPT